MLHPKQFAVNEAWIAFRLNSSPIRTQKDGDFDCIALMDAASCFILGSELFPAGTAGPSEASQLPTGRLLMQAKRHKQQFPRRYSSRKETSQKSYSLKRADRKSTR
jgi:hypothetical protein